MTDEQASVRELGVCIAARHARDRTVPAAHRPPRSTRGPQLPALPDATHAGRTAPPRPAPGSHAPDFELASTQGDRLRLRDLRGQAVLLHLVSYTCPVTRGGVHTMRELHCRYGQQVQFIEVLVRQAHPGERHGAYHTWEDKLADARAYRHEERLPWPVLVDDLGGRVQRAYGGLAAAAYLLDIQGRVAFCGTWGQSPALRQAIDELLARGGAGAPAGKGVDRRPHLVAAIVAGQSGPLRGGRRVLVDLELGFPGALLLMTVGRVGRPLLAPAGAAHHTAATPGTRRPRRRRARRRHRDRSRPTAPASQRSQPTRAASVARQGGRLIAHTGPTCLSP